MRPLRLDLHGFTVFRAETTIDFTDADFFALVGPTGSGKSTVLDAICFALYGQVPRWGSSRGIGNALAPSSAEARVRLVFESAGARYVATRVVRRDARGNAKTGNAGLQLMPPGFDITKLDTGMSPDDLGEVLAGTPAEMEAAVLEAVGLPYDQFTSCVVLPQGQFADFLHARPATRQQILVNLLGLGVYERVQRLATARATQAEAKLEVVAQELAGLADTDDATLAAAQAQLTAMAALVEAVGAGAPALAGAREAADRAEAALAELDAEVAELDRIRPPADAAELAGAVTAARAAAVEADNAVTQAEEREEKLRGELAAAGDAAALRLLVQAHEERDRLSAEAAGLRDALAEAQRGHEDAAAALAQARRTAERTSADLEAARRAYQDAQVAERAAGLRAQLAAGEPCPVCAQPVHQVPDLPAGSAVATARQAGEAARAAADTAAERVREAERVAADLDRAAERVRVRLEHLDGQLAALADRVADSPGPAALRRELESLAALRHELDTATGTVRTAREQARRARGDAEAAQERVRAAWRGFDAVRDGLARFGPPSADRSDLAAAWSALCDFAAAAARRRRADRDGAARAVQEAHAAVAALRAEIESLFAGHGLAAGADPARTAAVELERSRAQLRRIEERRDRAGALREQHTGHERAGRVARALAGHLRANNFERWLLAEALDLLVDGASRILRELSGGQYDLVHDKGEFFVIDQHDAGLRRGVRTLSGGETFQASLALALALSEQLAGLSTTSASLESIVLDEGFGTLDSATLDTVAATLENLAAQGDRMVGLVTHVPALAERVPVRFEVHKDARTARVERVG
ncbi:AAA family ATPase [Plantactinospora sp. KBS50]|uniref:AAA family ATPase n=1 Tax=Plantactinospora sp. KBS50 TaxID=2024580 RepID=UPI000BAAE47D|nr:SMC family ATPase [Plantactinospora sp. KBS50]ASW54221.1 chromosome segregation protein SMC [Plantactinospora sp. KBS50]